MGVNKVILLGNLGRDPEMRVLEGNVSRVSFSLATTESFKDKNGNKIDQTEWHNIVFWRSLADSAEKLLKKGMQIYVEGKLQTRNWQDKEGNKRQTTEIIGENFIILNRREHSNNPNNNTNQGQGNNATGNTDANNSGADLPF